MEIRFKHAVLTAGTHGFQRPLENVRGRRLVLAFETDRPQRRKPSVKAALLAALVVFTIWTAFVAMKATDMPDTVATVDMTGVVRW